MKFKKITIIIIIFALLLNPYLIGKFILYNKIQTKSAIGAILILQGVLLYTAILIQFHLKQKKDIIKISILIFIMLEIFSYIVMSIFKPDIPYDMKDYIIDSNCTYEQNALLGYTITANQTCYDARIIRNIKIFNKTYNINNQHQRLIKKESLHNKTLYLFGGSYIFGTGLSDNETIIYYLSKKFNVHPYAIPGYGTIQTYQNIKYYLNNNSKENNTIGIYVYIEDHLNRNIGSSRSIQMFNAPYYVIEKNKLVTKGSFWGTRKIKTTAYYIYSKYLRRNSNFLRLLNLQFPIKLSNEDIALTAKMIKSSADEFKNKTNGEFYLLIHPESQHKKNTQKLINMLKNSGIQILQYPIEYDANKYQISRSEPHPNNELNKILSDYIIKTFN